MAYTVSSLLEQAPLAQTIDEKAQSGVDNTNQVQVHLNMINQCLHENFWEAYDALDFKKSANLLGKGIKLAKEMQQAIVRVGQGVIDRKEIKVSTGFRYMRLENDELKDMKVFQFPLALMKLGLFIMELYLSEKKTVVHKPLVISVKSSKTNNTLVMAITGYMKT